MKTIFLRLFFIALLCNGAAYGQLNFFFLPEINSRFIDGLGTFQVQNLTQRPMNGQVLITVQETRSRLPVVTVSTPEVNFAPGMTSFPKAAFSSSRFSFEGNAIASIVNQTRNFPPGDYSFCFRFVPTDKQIADVYENCFDATVQPFVPISLLVPSNQDTICLKRPFLSWQPPMPYHPSMRYRLLLTEKNGDAPYEAVLKNTPLLLLDNISSSGINYPSSYPELKEGKTYYWQVVAYQQGIVISTSEVWEFTVQCKETTQPVPTDSYRELKLLVNGNYYVANGVLRFSFQNRYHIEKLSYSILDPGNGGKEIRHLPEVQIQPGLNKVDLDLRELDLKAGQHYLLKVYPFNEPPVEVRFVYQENYTAL